MQIGMIGLGRMGANMARRLCRAATSASPTTAQPEAVRRPWAPMAPAAWARSPSSCARSKTPRAVWIMVPAALVDTVIAELRPLLAPATC